jgi:hypothetical protein
MPPPLIEILDITLGIKEINGDLSFCILGFLTSLEHQQD